MANSNPAYTHRITFLRHGESTGNAQGVYQGRAEFELSGKGRRQVQALAKFWQDQGITFSRIISSPQARARQSAEIISDVFGIPLEFDDQLQEIDNGALAGLTREQADELDVLPDFMSPFDAIGESGESNWALYLRAGEVIQALLKRPAGDYLVVSHGGFLNRILYVILGIAPQANFSGPRFHFDNTAYAVLRYNPSRHVWVFDQFNDHQHRPEE